MKTVLKESVKKIRTNLRLGDIANKPDVFAADSETTTAGAAEIVIIGYSNIYNHNVKKQYSAEEFFDALEADDDVKDKSIFYFHNLEFDYSFLLNAIRERGYEKAELIMGAAKTHYQVVVKVGKKRIVFRDSAYLFSSGYIALDVVMNEWNTHYKGKKRPAEGEDFHYAHKPRPDEIRDDYMAYFLVDVLGLAEALTVRFQMGDKKVRLTSSAQSYRMLQDSINTAFRLNYDNWCEQYAVPEPMDDEELMKYNRFDVLFPRIKFNVDRFLRRGYAGGFCYVNPMYQTAFRCVLTEKRVKAGQITDKEIKERRRKSDGSVIKSKRIPRTMTRVDEKVLYDVHVYDINSYYPYVMATMRLPKGRPQKGKGSPFDNPAVTKYNRLFVSEFTVEYLRLRTGNQYVPFMTNAVINEGGSKIYIEDTPKNSPVELRTFVLTSIEYEMLLKNYETGNITHHEYYYFDSAVGICKNFIDELVELKNSNDGAVRSFYKLMLNSLYGKFGQRTIQAEYEWDYDPDKNEGRETLRHIPYDDEDPYLTKNGAYLPMAMFITAHARMGLIKLIGKIGMDNFIYCDTDSIHTRLRLEDVVEVHPKKLGAFKHEYMYTKCKYISTKRYAGIKEGETDTTFTVAGAKQKDFERSNISFDEFMPGVSVTVQRMRIQPGGGKQIESGIYTL